MSTTGLDHPRRPGAWGPSSRLLMLLMLLATTASAASAAAVSAGRRLPPWVLRTRGGANIEAGSDGEGPAGVLKSSDFELVEEADRYRGRWRSILKREVRYPDGRLVDFDVMDQPGSSVMVFIWNSTDRTTTLIEEYAPGPLDVICGPVAGGCEDHKHKDSFEAARHELEEEAHLIGGTWHVLLDGEDTTAVADKYSTAPFTFYMVVDPEFETDPKPHDHEELLVIHRGISLEETRRLIRQGKMTVPAALTCLLAIERLQELGLIEGEAKVVVGEDGEGKRPRGEMDPYDDMSEGETDAEIEEDEDGGFTFPSERGAGKEDD